MIVNFVETKEKRIPFSKKDCYVFREDKSFHLLQRICCWTMHKIGAFDMGETVTVTRYTIDSDVFMERIFKQQKHLLGYFNRKPKRLLIGSEDFSELMNSAEVRDVMMFNASYNYGREIYGLQVEVIPWMRGILVMP